MRPLRFLPRGHLIEVTTRTVHGRLLLLPDAATCDVIRGVLGRAQARHRMPIVAFTFLCNHYHLLLLPDSSQHLAEFMAYFNSNMAREVGRIHEWREKFWSRRYYAITVSDEEAAQVGRLRYLLSHGAKEGFVASPSEWPGPNVVATLLESKAIQGIWFDRTAEYVARRRRGAEVFARDFASTEAVTLTPLPCWSHWSEEKRRDASRDLILDIEREAKASRNGRPPVGRDAILKQHPHDVPGRSKHSPAPAFHAATKEARRLLREAYRLFVNAFRRASELLRAGCRVVEFPQGSFPPAPPYVPIASG